MKRILTAIIWLLSLNLVYCQDYKELKGIQYKEIICGKSVEVKEMPVLFALHFTGAKPESLIKHFASFEFPVKVVFIIGVNEVENGFTYYPLNYHDEFNADQKAKAQKEITKQLSKFIRTYKKRNKIKSKIGIIGASEGGDLSLLLAINYPELFDFSIPIAATIQLDALFRIPKNKNQTKIKLIHGTDDQIVKIEIIRKIQKHLKIMNYDIDLHEYKNRKHEISDEMILDYTKWIENFN